MTECKTNPALLKLIEESVAKVKAMSSEERDDMLRRQGESYARAEASWPKAKFKWVNGAKVYDTYEDFCND